MPAIILEGPDGSGKTTLAEALYASVPLGRLTYVKSPAGRSAGWASDWDSWALDHALGSNFYLLDRTPEISEPIYAAGQGRLPRSSRSAFKLDEILLEDRIFLVVARAQSNPTGGHHDPMGQAIDHDKVRTLYHGLETVIKTYMPSFVHATATTYEYWSNNSVKETLWKMNQWVKNMGGIRHDLGPDSVIGRSQQGRSLMRNLSL